MVKLNILTSSVLLLAGFTSALPTLEDLLGGSDAQLAPLFHAPDAEIINDSYIVVLKDHVDTNAAQSHCHSVGSFAKRGESLIEYLDTGAMEGIKLTYDTPGLRGYAGKFSLETLHHIRSSPEVAFVEKDSMMYASEMQRNAPWGLSRISHRTELTLRTFNKYEHDENGGEGVKVFVIDTGINVDHRDFHGRASWGATFAKDGDNDGNGHGSHCAGTIAGQRFGVAKQANPVAVKVLSAQGSGSNSEVLAGINWAVEQHQIDAADAKKNGRKYKGAVANMSLGGGKSQALDRAVNNAVDEGLIFSVAAGNDNRDACKYSPAAAANAITVGATNLRDERAYFSNYGECVDVFAPGQDIMSIWNTSPYSTNTISGTSMAAPHVAGLAAYFLSLDERENVTPKMIKDKIIELGTRNKLKNIPNDGTPNLLVFNDFSA
ncbi:hypothetical protein INT45_010320 [Circinella minor]|uniref:Uncharacterized protein n=1 Tax=Circinella minor TaxID=1195481 RepID=A0A8H7SCG2_9FUNG|nr:hypothetical protein INT45_010320 [Circinella minor]